MTSSTQPPIERDHTVQLSADDEAPRACGVTVFDKDSEGRLQKVETFDAPDKAHARRAAEEASRHHRGAVAFEDHETTDGTVHAAVYSCETFPSR